MPKYTAALTLLMMFLLSACASSITGLSGIAGIGYGSRYSTVKQTLIDQHFAITQDQNTGTGYWLLQAEGPSAGGEWARFWRLDCQQVGFLFPSNTHTAQNNWTLDVFQQGPCAKDRKKQATKPQQGI